MCDPLCVAGLVVSEVISTYNRVGLQIVRHGAEDVTPRIPEIDGVTTQ